MEAARVPVLRAALDTALDMHLPSEEAARSRAEVSLCGESDPFKRGRLAAVTLGACSVSQPKKRKARRMGQVFLKLRCFGASLLRCFSRRLLLAISGSERLLQAALESEDIGDLHRALDSAARD